MPYKPWTYNVPYTEFPGKSSSLTPGGHPTAVGPNKRMVIAGTNEDGVVIYAEVPRDRLPRAGAYGIGNGSPGTPRLAPAYNNAAAIPGEFGRPIQPGTNYNNGSDTSGP